MPLRTIIAILSLVATQQLQAQPTPQARQRRFDYIYTQAATQAQHGNHAAAFNLYHHSHTIQPQSDQALDALAGYHSLLDQDSIAQQLLRKAITLNPNNTNYIEHLAAIYIQNNDNQQALPLIQQLATLRPNNIGYLSRLEQAYEQQSLLQEAIHTLDRIETLQGRMQATTQRKAILYQRLQQPQQALQELQALVDANPHDDTYRLLLANYHLTTDQPHQAHTILTNLQQSDPNTPGLKYAWLNYYKQTNQDTIYNTLRDSLLYDPHTDDELREYILRNIILQIIQLPDSTSAIQAQQLFANLDSLLPPTKYIEQYHLAYLTTQPNTQEQQHTIIQHIYNLDPTDQKAINTLIQDYAQTNNHTQIEDITRRSILIYPEQLIYHYYLAITLLQQDPPQHNQAIHTLQEGLRQRDPQETSPQLIADTYQLLGDLHHQQGHINQTFAAYDSALIYNPDYPLVLNNYAYYLSLQGQDLDRAEEMSYRSLRRDPDNPTYLDTYAYILFLKGAYTEAQAYIDRVCPPTATDSALLATTHASRVILEHAGDIAAQAGNINQALRFWQLAATIPPDDDDTQPNTHLRRKIRRRKYIKP